MIIPPKKAPDRLFDIILGYPGTAIDYKLNFRRFLSFCQNFIVSPQALDRFFAETQIFCRNIQSARSLFEGAMGDRKEISVMSDRASLLSLILFQCMLHSDRDCPSVLVRRADRF
jgi:hypothetical protein